MFEIKVVLLNIHYNTLTQVVFNNNSQKGYSLSLPSCDI